MKHLNLAVGIVVLASQHLTAQDQSTSLDQARHPKDTVFKLNLVYKAELVLNSGATTRGYLHEVSDSNVVMYPVKVPFHFENDADGPLPWAVYHYSDLDKVIVRRSGVIATGGAVGALLGGLTGFALGSLANSVNQAFDYNGQPTPNPTFGATIIGAASGALIGVLIGALARKTFIIDSNKQNMRHMQKRLYRPLLK